ncbi:M61 family metallopeptidase [Pseudomonadota bacterium]
MHYSITPYKLAAHLFKVTCSIPNPDIEGQVVSLPAWIPGSYMIREFAKNIVTISASCEGQAVPLTKTDKSTWRADRCEGTLDIEYQVYAWDLSVRSAHMDTRHAYFNGTSVFLKAHGKDELPVTVDILAPSEGTAKEWRVATSMTMAGATQWEFGRYSANSYDELIDHPVEIGEFELASFEVSGTPHHVVISGKHNTDTVRLCKDLKEICEAEIAFFGELPSMDRYVFLVWVVGDGYGGLEHRESCSLICSRGDLPWPGMGELTDGYKSFLGLCSHEYFHTWNVKRIKPAGFIPYELSSESYTRQLWAFEGITSYYDDLILARSGRISSKEYLTLLARTSTRVWMGKGRASQSVADSSFDAWTKFYKQDENAPNAIVSYYTKGSLIALALDITIRQLSCDTQSLDTLMCRLWLEYGKQGIGVPEGEIERIAADVAGQSLDVFFDSYLYGTDDLPLEELLAYVGVAFSLRAPLSEGDKGGSATDAASSAYCDLGMRTVSDSMGVKVANIFSGGAAEKGGLSSGDIIIAVDALKVTKSGFDDLLRQYSPGDQMTIHGFRRDELIEFSVCLEESERNRVELTFISDADEQTIARREDWLKSEMV